jgi:hypothetical protein
MSTTGKLHYSIKVKIARLDPVKASGKPEKVGKPVGRDLKPPGFLVNLINVSREGAYRTHSILIGTMDHRCRSTVSLHMMGYSLTAATDRRVQPAP